MFTVDETIKVKSLPWSRFKNYWYKQWRRANISEYVKGNRTNNNAETLNKSTTPTTPYPNIWELLEQLDLYFSNKIIGADDRKMFLDHNKSVTISVNMRIRRTTDFVDRTEDIKRFLNNVTHDIKLNVSIRDNRNFNEMDEYENDDYDGIVPTPIQKEK